MIRMRSALCSNIVQHVSPKVLFLNKLPASLFQQQQKSCYLISLVLDFHISCSEWTETKWQLNLVYQARPSRNSFMMMYLMIIVVGHTVHRLC